jgi:hypothetical protein
LLDQSIRSSALTYSFRLPPPIIELISRIYRRDDISLEGETRDLGEVHHDQEGSWERVWEGDYGIYLVLHDERQSRRYNPIETQIIVNIINAGGDRPNNSVAVVTPYRAQRSHLNAQLEQDPRIFMIDTIERIQGGECPTVIVSATASDPSAISTNAEFILNLQRTNVAFSRSQDRLIVVCSEELMNHIPSEIEYYDSAMLWKSLRGLCNQLVATLEIDGHEVRIYTYIPHT